VRELISNVLRHSGATRVKVRVTWDEVRLISEVEDDGMGFQESKVSVGHGIANVRRRLRELGGTLRYLTVEEGTLARIEIPLAAPSVSLEGENARPSLEPVVFARVPLEERP
jgi:signal transduction histidine kinase